MGKEKAGAPDTIEALGCAERPESMGNGKLVKTVMVGLYAESVLEERMGRMVGGVFERLFGEGVMVCVARRKHGPNDRPGTVYADSAISWGTMDFLVQPMDEASRTIITDRFKPESAGISERAPWSVWDFVCDAINRDCPELHAKVCALGGGADVSISMLELVQSAKGDAPDCDDVAATSSQLVTHVVAVLDGAVPGSSGRRGPGGW